MLEYQLHKKKGDIMINRESFAALFENRLNERRLTLAEFVQRMNAYGIKTSYQQAYRWKKGTTLPNALQFLAICNVLKIENLPKQFSESLYTNLLEKEEKQSNIVAFDPETDDKISHRQLPIILQKASAGYGQYVDDADIEMVYVRESVPDVAGFGIYVSGDSMEPKYHNGDLVWCEKKDKLNSGEVGVFYLDGNIYIKRLEYGQGSPCLRSLNRKYKPIPITEDSVFTIWGRVL